MIHAMTASKMDSVQHRGFLNSWSYSNGVAGVFHTCHQRSYWWAPGNGWDSSVSSHFSATISETEEVIGSSAGQCFSCSFLSSRSACVDQEILITIILYSSYLWNWVFAKNILMHIYFKKCRWKGPILPKRCSAKQFIIILWNPVSNLFCIILLWYWGNWKEERFFCLFRRLLAAFRCRIPSEMV